ncbi:60S acidic ribosomal protein P0 [Podospora didyma]|uniref:Large ribosomal subunit protein uL10 n=1 Tax=Podospora didyma TaxID=330526 RepID=A0AAE0P7Z6_9PEZI|nr:60S acidic ribosomal protein P0 [Podospora didyma]
MGGKSENKAGYFDKLKGLLQEYNSIFIVSVDNVSSQQMHEIRQSLRGEGVVLMGKNTMVRRALKTFMTDIPEYERLLPFVKGNIGFVFTNGDLKEIRDKILANKVAAPARAGAVAPTDVYVPAGNTGMEPGKTSFFQALGVPTKIARGTIEITTDLKLVDAGGKVGASEATLLNMLNISPFTYGMGISQVYDQGNTFPPAVLDIGEDQLLKAFSTAVTTIACLSLAINFPTLPSVIHSLVNTYKRVLAVAVETEISWPEIVELKDRIANPEAYAAAAPVATESATKEETKAAEESDKDSDEGSDSDGGFGGLLLVPPQSYYLLIMRLTQLKATKCNDVVKVFLEWQLWFRSLKAVEGLDLRLHRSFCCSINATDEETRYFPINDMCRTGPLRNAEETFELEVSTRFLHTKILHKPLPKARVDDYAK